MALLVNIYFYTMFIILIQLNKNYYIFQIKSIEIIKINHYHLGYFLNYYKFLMKKWLNLL